ncbi:MAG: hypothetical protein ACLFNU_10115 [Bacteroidales bacterium]
MRKIVIILVALLFTLILNGQVATNYKITAEFFPENAQLYNYPVSNKNFMRAYSQIKLEELNSDSVEFYLHSELHIDSILLNKRKLEYKSEKILFNRNYNLTALKITFPNNSFPEGTEIEIYYSGFFNPSKVRSLSDYMRINLEEGVFLRSYGYSVWFPVFKGSITRNALANFESITVKTPSDFRCVVTGDLKSEKIENNIYTSVWEPGIEAIRDIQCTAQRYKIETKGSIHVYYLTNKLNAQKILQFTEKLNGVFKSNLKKLNKENALYILEMPEYGDISSSNVIGLSDDTFNNFDNASYSKFTIAHELVHPYVKIDVAQENPFFALVIEGFPSFFQIYAMHKINSETDTKNIMLRVEKNYIKKRETGKNSRGNQLPSEKPILEIRANEIGLYKDNFILNDRVWLFLFDLWEKMGDEKFDVFLKKLFELNEINYPVFEELVNEHINNYNKKLHIWLHTNEFPEDLRISKNY